MQTQKHRGGVASDHAQTEHSTAGGERDVTPRSLRQWLQSAVTALSELRRETENNSQRLMRIEQRLANGRTAKTELSPREREIAELRRKGAKEMEIAARLNIAEGTVKAVEQRIRRKEMQRKQSRSA